jgi:hypothetical protein
MWMPPAGDLMLGASRTVINGAVREFEHLRLRAAGDTLVYTALPSGQRETDFRSTRVTADTIVFENPAHDFPQRIIYSRRGADSIVARVEGPGPNNTTRGFSVPMRRVDCTQPIAAPIATPPDTVVIDAAYSRDGRELLFRSNRDRVSNELYRTKADDTEVTLVTRTADVTAPGALAGTGGRRFEEA